MNFIKLKANYVLLYLVVCSTNATAQFTPEQRIQDSVIGWWNNKKYDSHIKPTNDPVQKKRIQICDSIVSWVKKSYTPVAGLGTFSRINNKNWYGATFEVWNVSHDKMWTDEKGNFKPIPEENTPFGIMVNALPAILPIDFLNDIDDYYFSWEPDGYMTEQTANRRKGYDFKNNPNVNKFITRISNNQNCVILSPGNKPAFVQVSIGEFLNKAEASVDKEKRKEKERINNTFSGTSEGAIKIRAESWARKEKEFEVVLKRINKWRNLHKNRLEEPATFRASHQTLLTAFNDEDTDPFNVRDVGRERKQYMVVYKISKETIDKCRTDQPQWLVAWWPFNGKNDGNQLYEMSTSMMENVNYEYIYNYFFSPAKIKGIAYSPVNETQLKARLAAYRNNYRSSVVEVVSSKPAASTAFLHDDFSSGSVGAAPPNWYYFKTGTTPFVITNPGGLEGNWLKLGYGRKISYSFFKSAFPHDFKLEFDVATDKDFATRSGGGIELILNTEKFNKTYENQEERLQANGTVMKIGVVSGNAADLNNNNFRGSLKVTIHSSPAVNRENFEEGIIAEKPLRDFSSTKNKVHIEVVVKAGKPSIYSNGNLLIEPADFKMKYGSACILCGIPTGRQFNALALNNITNNPGETSVYISNLKISKN